MAFGLRISRITRVLRTDFCIGVALLLVLSLKASECYTAIINGEVTISYEGWTKVENETVSPGVQHLREGTIAYQGSYSGADEVSQETIEMLRMVRAWAQNDNKRSYRFEWEPWGYPLKCEAIHIQVSELKGLAYFGRPSWVLEWLADNMCAIEGSFCTRCKAELTLDVKYGFKTRVVPDPTKFPKGPEDLMTESEAIYTVTFVKGEMRAGGCEYVDNNWSKACKLFRRARP